MASPVPTSTPLPTNFYLRNPLALLVARHNLLDGALQGISNTRLRHDDVAVSKPGADTSMTSEKNSPESDSFIADSTPSKTLIDELANMLESSQIVAPQEGSKLTSPEKGAGVARSNVSATRAKKSTPYQLLWSETYQCFTSLAFYGAMLAQLKRWAKQLDAATPVARQIVWAHLFCLIGSNQTSSDPITPILASITSQARMELLDIELLHLSVVLSAKYSTEIAQLLRPATNAAPATTSSLPTASDNGNEQNDKDATEKTTTKPQESDSEGDTAAKLANFSKTSIVANAVGFSQHYRGRLVDIHRELIDQITALRKTQLATTNNAANSPTSSQDPSSNDLVFSLAMRQLTTLISWQKQISELSTNELEAVFTAVQSVPAFKALENGLPPSEPHSAGRLLDLLQKWELAPRQHLTAISSLYNALIMLSDFGVIKTSFKPLRHEDFAQTSGAQHLPPFIPPSAFTAALPMVSKPTATTKPIPAQFTNPYNWGSSPLPTWSPVPSPLTTFPGAFGSLSPLTFIPPSQSPITFTGAPANPVVHIDSTFGNLPPQGVLLPTLSRAVPAQSLPVLKNGAEPAGPKAAFSAVIGGRSAFGALKRAAEEAADCDIPTKRHKATEVDN